MMTLEELLTVTKDFDRQAVVAIETLGDELVPARTAMLSTNPENGRKSPILSERDMRELRAVGEKPTE